VGPRGDHSLSSARGEECANAFYLAVLADGIIAGDDPSVLAGDDHDRQIEVDRRTEAAP
jgi:hypothetical protein